MAVAEEVVRIAEELRPDQCTLVPEQREELTTEGGLDVVRHRSRVVEVVKRLGGVGIVTSAFVEPIPEQVRASAEGGFEAIELWTGRYAHAHNKEQQRTAMDELRRAIDIGHEVGLEVHGGHGLTYRNIGPIAAMPGFGEFNIGHSIVSRAVFVGMRGAVREMKELLAKHAP